MVLPLLRQLGHRARGLAAALGDRDVGRATRRTSAYPSAGARMQVEPDQTQAAPASLISVSITSPPPAPAGRRPVPSCRSISASIFSSTVPRQTNLWTSTFCFWPMRKARSVAWFSTAGFHQRSKWMTCEAAVRFRPDAAGLQREHEEGRSRRSWKRATSSLRLLAPRCAPCSTSPGGRRRRPGTRPADRSSRGTGVNTSAFSCLAAISSASSRRRANLPLSASGQPPSPSHCEGWLQICLNRMRNASTSALALDALRRSSQRLGQLVDRLLVERRLLAAQAAERA